MLPSFCLATEPARPIGANNLTKILLALHTMLGDVVLTRLLDRKESTYLDDRVPC
jgi:hypothetical protein